MKLERHMPGCRALGARLLAVALLSLPFASPSQAVATADAGPQQQQQQRSTDDGTAQDVQAIRRELDNFRAAQISLSRAMAIAEGLHAGATTADVSFDGNAAPAVYRIKTVQRDKLWQHDIDAATGAVTGGEAASPLASLGTEDRNNLAVLSALRHRLPEAVQVAERSTSGKAISGGMVRERGKLNFVIIVLSGSDLKEVLLEPPGARGH